MSLGDSGGIAPSAMDISDSAEYALAEHLNSIRDRIVREASSLSRADGDCEIRATDISRAIEQISQEEMKLHFFNRVRRVVRLGASITPLMIVLPAVSVYVYRTSESQDFPWPALIAGLIAGLFVPVAPEVATRILRKRIARITNRSHEFVRVIARLESEARSYAANIGGEEVAEGSLSVVFDLLKMRRIWTDDDIHVFRLLLRIRNSVVHEGKILGSDHDFENAIAQATKLHELIPQPPRTIGRDLRRQASDGDRRPNRTKRPLSVPYPRQNIHH
ncbi:hypothetical protein ACFHW1_09875 [Micromonospora sp. LOL_014]|uniref:hypothetical protein n=1 Tax=Micromonospora sp. LOL_014 TaxID=3345415 RepID=UPI003A8A2A67